MAKLFENLLWLIFGLVILNWITDGEISREFLGTKKHSPAYTQEFDYSQYETISGQALMDYLKVNPATANHKLKGKKVQIVGCKISRIDSDGESFMIEAKEEILSLSGIHCYIEKKSIAQAQLFKLSLGQPVDVYGKITRVGDTLGYSVDAYRIELPNQISGDNAGKTQTSTNSNIGKNDISDVRDVMNNFVRAYVLHDRDKISQYSFYPAQRFSKEKCFELMDNQTNSFDRILDIYSKYQKQNISYEWSVKNIQLINDDTYTADVDLTVATNTLRFPDIQVRKINGVWIVDGESFTISSSQATVSAFVQ